ncbi:MAG: hypothetical protein IPG06_17565 [Haliea sp.]|nr:hypothetical protein [Haliea sp.]
MVTTTRLLVNVYRMPVLALLIICSLSLAAVAALSAVATTVPISAALATSIAADLFPVTVKVSNGNLHLTQPVAQFLDNERVGMAVRIQAYDHRPAQGIAISEMGRATISGKLGYDPATQQVLLTDPRIETLEFDQKNVATQDFLAAIKSAWSVLVTNPMRAPMPPHPYLLPFRNNIQDLSYDGKNIMLTVSYQ